MPIPPWAKTIGDNTQASNDAKYQADLVEYRDRACPNWIATNIINRGNGAAITPFPLIPQRVTLVWNDSTGWYDSVLDPIDPAIQHPSLPPQPNVDHGAPLTTGAGAYDAQVLGLLNHIAARLETIAAKVGA